MVRIASVGIPGERTVEESGHLVQVGFGENWGSLKGAPVLAEGVDDMGRDRHDGVPSNVEDRGHGGAIAALVKGGQIHVREIDAEDEEGWARPGCSGCVQGYDLVGGQVIRLEDE